MTVSSKSTTKADIVMLPSARNASASNTVALRSRGGGTTQGQSATLISIRQHLSFKASIGINDFAFLERSYSGQVVDKLMSSIREILNQEFGHLRVHRRHQAFVVRHGCMDSLVAGLLRVQFHSCQIPLPATREGDSLSDVCGVPLTWGVGQTYTEADSERLEKQKK